MQSMNLDGNCFITTFRVLSIKADACHKYHSMPVLPSFRMFFSTYLLILNEQIFSFYASIFTFMRIYLRNNSWKQ